MNRSAGRKQKGQQEQMQIVSNYFRVQINQMRADNLRRTSLIGCQWLPDWTFTSDFVCLIN